MSETRVVYLVDGARTPFLKARGRPGNFSAADLAVAAGKALLVRQPFEPNALNEVIFGCVAPSVDEANIARIIALRLGCGEKMPAFTVQRNCASGMQSVDTACRNIAHGYADLVLAGGAEAMSHTPLLFNNKMVNWLADWNAAKSLPQRLKTLSRIRPGHFAPVIGLLRGLRDPVVGVSMGQTAENLAYRFGIDRQQMDVFAVQSHSRLALAFEEGRHSEIVPLASPDGQALSEDDGLRRDSSMEKLARLKPFFDKPYGNVTAGNSSQITDGAAVLLLASEDAVKRFGLEVLAKLHPAQWAGLDPAQMGLGPAHAIAATLVQHQLPLPAIDYWEINEAFAAQVIACLMALEDEEYCCLEIGLQHALGKIDMEALNIDGGAISQGHPVGASGARIILHLAHILRRNHASRGIASLCIGGGQGGAMLVEGMHHA